VTKTFYILYVSIRLVVELIFVLIATPILLFLGRDSGEVPLEISFEDGFSTDENEEDGDVP